MLKSNKLSRRTIDIIQRLERRIGLKICTKNWKFADYDGITSKLEWRTELIPQELQMLKNPQPVKQRFKINPAPICECWIGEEKIRKTIVIDIKIVHKGRDYASLSSQKEGLLHWQIESSHRITEKGQICECR